jgi:hypothetical protein
MPSQTFLPPDEAKRLILAAAGKPFLVHFVKRSDGGDRLMLAKLVPPKPGGKPPYDAAAHGLQVVWDVERGAYRSVPLDAVLSFATLEQLLAQLQQPAKRASLGQLLAEASESLRQARGRLTEVMAKAGDEDAVWAAVMSLVGSGREVAAALEALAVRWAEAKPSDLFARGPYDPDQRL